MSMTVKAGLKTLDIFSKYGKCYNSIVNRYQAILLAVEEIDIKVENLSKNKFLNNNASSAKSVGDLRL